jgi:O-antigen ligase
VPEGSRRTWSPAARWGGIPLYGAVLLQGMPLDRHLGAWRSSISQDAQQQLIERVTTVGATQSVLPAVIWGGLYLAALFLLMLGGNASSLRRLSKRQWPLLALLALGFLSAAWSPNTGKVIASSFHALGVTLIAMVAAIRCAEHVPSFLKALCSCFALNLLVHLGCVMAAPDVGIANDGRWMGMATHSNTLGGVALVGVWAGFMAVAVHRGRSRISLIAALGVSLVVLIGSGSTTSLVCAVTAIGVAVFLMVSGTWPVELKRLANVAAFLAAIGMAAAIVASDSIIGKLTERLGKSDDFTGRSELWEHAWRLIKQHPVLGWGFDDNARVIVETGFSYPSFHNGYLDLGVRGGAVALLIMGLGFWCWLRAIVRVDVAWRRVCVPMMGGFLMYNLMEVSLFSPRNVIWLIVLLLMFCTVLRTQSASGVGRFTALPSRQAIASSNECSVVD